jgi:hypothetical protein
MAAKRHKKHKNKISGIIISMAYNEPPFEDPISRTRHWFANYIPFLTRFSDRTVG